MAVDRPSGRTPTERILAELCEKSFLSLWSYPHVYRDQGQLGEGDGKEVCDLMVVCGFDVILFSVKYVKFPGTYNSPIAWSRWCKRAVVASARQLHGAERWLSWPDRLFVDAKCQQALPISLPSPESRRVHRVVVALGAGEACREYFGSGTGSLVVLPGLRGESHTNADNPDFAPFSIGDLDPERNYVHVLDDATLELLLSELDTVTDFICYLNEKEWFIRSGHLVTAAGEEELLGYYLAHTNANGEHAFVPLSGRDSWEPTEYCTLSEGIWETTKNSPQFRAKREADKVSYLWDEMIEKFARHLIDGTARVEDPVGTPIAHFEQALRVMALESRFERRILAAQIVAAIDNGLPDRRYARIIGLYEPPRNRAAYVFLQLPFNASSGAPDYEKYRQYRSANLHAYCLVVKADYPSIPRVLAIGTEPPKFSGGIKTSEDILMLEVDDWGAEHQREADELRERFEILSPRTLSLTTISESEYPDTDSE